MCIRRVRGQSLPTKIPNTSNSCDEMTHHMFDHVTNKPQWKFYRTGDPPNHMNLAGAGNMVAQKAHMMQIATNPA